MPDSDELPPTNNDSIDFVADAETKASGQEVDSDTAPAISAAVYGATSSRLSFQKAAFVEQQAAFEMRLPDAQKFLMTAIANNQANAAIQGDEEKNQEQVDELRAAVATFTDQQDREREEWQRELSTFGTVTMSGADWSEFSNDLKTDSPLRRWLIDKAKKDGKTDTQANALADRMASVTAIMAIRESQRTEEQKKILADAKADPDFSDYIEQTHNKRDELEATHTVAASVISEGASRQSVIAGADEISSFPSAPKVQDHYQAAVAMRSLDSVVPARMSSDQRPNSVPVVASGLDV